MQECSLCGKLAKYIAIEKGWYLCTDCLDKEMV